MPDEFQLPVNFDYGATFLWATSGALLAARRGYDIVGIFAIALVSATGGGLIRDGVFLQTTPILVREPAYMTIVTVATVLVLVFGRHLGRSRVFDQTIGLADAAGLGAYAVFGAQLTLAHGLGPAAALLVGSLNAVGGGLLRDVLMGHEPDLFKPGRLMATAALAGCVVFLALSRSANLAPNLAGWCAIGAAFVIRLVSVRYGWYTRAVDGLRDGDRRPRAR